VSVTVKLGRRYTAHDQSFDSVTLREPTFSDIYVDGLGEPEEAQPLPGGGYMVVTNYPVIAQYVERLAIAPTFECLTQLSPTDSRRVKKAITGFFREEAEKETPDGSSSDTASTQTASKE
jgi:hypothetical protein